MLPKLAIHNPFSMTSLVYRKVFEDDLRMSTVSEYVHSKLTT